ncbi:MAG: hypothetical protein GF329_22680 [Candidatus Lokiarchaeota archaeon]|nr:hypothetical protein [Candidatus Lokiarchaeota archaeon]
MVINVIDEPLDSIIDKIHLLRNLGIKRIVIHSLEGFLATSPGGISDLDMIFSDLETSKNSSVPYTAITEYHGFPLYILKKYIIFAIDFLVITI